MLRFARRDSQTQSVIDKLKKIYKTKLHPVEALYKFNEFYRSGGRQSNCFAFRSTTSLFARLPALCFSPFMLDSEFDAVPQASWLLVKYGMI